MLSDALGEIARGLEVVEFACGARAPDRRARSPRTSRPASTSYSLPPAARRGRHHQPVQLPGDGAAVVLPDRDRAPATPSSSSRARRIRPPRTGSPSCSQEAGLPRRRAQRACRATRRPSTRCCEHPDVAVDLVRRLDPDRAVHLRDRGTRTASACRRSAARRTTCWCCPTPTSTSPPTPAVNAGFGSAGERCMAHLGRARGRARSPTPLVAADQRARRRREIGDGAGDGTRGATWGPLISDGSTATRSPGTSTRRRRRTARTSSSTAATSQVDGAADGFCRRPDADRPRAPTSCRSTATRSSARCCRSCARPAYEEALDLINCQPVRQRHRDLHERRRRRPRVPARGARSA